LSAGLAASGLTSMAAPISVEIAIGREKEAIDISFVKCG
jgi:hypothetical protein